MKFLRCSPPSTTIYPATEPTILCGVVEEVFYDDHERVYVRMTDRITGSVTWYEVVDSPNIYSTQVCP